MTSPLYRLVLVVLICTPAVAQNPDAIRSDPERLAIKVIGTIESVVENHVDPPTRDALIHAFCRTLDAEPKRPIGLGRELSSGDGDRLRAIVSRRIGQLAEEQREAHVAAALQQTLNRFADSKIVLRKEQRVQNQLQANRYVGIGIALGTQIGQPKILRVFDDGPADQGGVKGGDIIRQVDETPITNQSVGEVVELLRGPEGSDVTIVVAQDDQEPRKLKLTRNVVPFQQVKRFQVLEPGIASVDLLAVTGSIVSDLRRLTPQIRQHDIKGVVLSIRSNQVGYRPALMFANAMIDGGRIGGLETESGIEPIVAQPDRLWPGVEVAVVSKGGENDSMAWLLHALSQHRQSPVVRPGLMGIPIQAQHAWVYGEVARNDDEFVFVLPRARLLGFDSSSGKDDAYVDLTVDQIQPRRPINPLVKNPSADNVAPVPINGFQGINPLIRPSPLKEAVARLKALIQAKELKALVPTRESKIDDPFE